MNPNGSPKYTKCLVCILLAGITIAAFASLANSAFINWDDPWYVTGNGHIQHGFSWNAVKWAFQAFYAANWHPLTWLSLILDFQLYGPNPSGYHLTNLAFHVANTVLLFLLLENLTARLWPSAFVAMLFAIHPMHVESVAWVSERKDVLSAFFFLLTLLAYARYVELANAKRHLAWSVFGIALVFFALGLMAKPMLVTLPFVLLLLDYWPLQRFTFPAATKEDKDWTTFRRPLIEKIPFFLLAAASCWITFIAQKNGGAVAPDSRYVLAQRLGHVSVSYVWYLSKCFRPDRLSVYYELKTITVSAWEVLWTSLLLLVPTAFALLRLRKYPFFFFGWFWFVGMFVPVIGVVQVGGQSYADRYAYLPYIGLFVILAWGVPELVRQASGLSPQLRRAGIWAAAVLVVAACFWRTLQEVHYWKNGVTLFQRAVALDPKDETSWAVLGSEYAARGDYDKAIESLNRSVKLNDRFFLSWEFFGHALALKGDYAGAAHAYQMALQYSWYQKDKISNNNLLGDALANAGRYADAISAYQNSLQLSSDQPEIQTKLGENLVKNQLPEQAAVAFQDAIDLEPDDAAAQLGLAMFLAGNGRDAEALGHFQKALESDTNSVMVLNNFAWLLASSSDPSIRNGQEAVSLAERACQGTHYREAMAIGTLAAAYAEAGRFDDAVAVAQKAHDVALAQGQKDVAEHNLKLMGLYKSHQPFHMPAPAPSP